MEGKDILAFTVGAIVGVLGGILLAPSSGRNSIDQLISKIKKHPVTQDDQEDRNLYGMSDVAVGIEDLEKLRAEF